jgi:hypothetical protein
MEGEFSAGISYLGALKTAVGDETDICVWVVKRLDAVVSPALSPKGVGKHLG